MTLFARFGGFETLRVVESKLSIRTEIRVQGPPGTPRELPGIPQTSPDLPRAAQPPPDLPSAPQSFPDLPDFLAAWRTAAHQTSGRVGRQAGLGGRRAWPAARLDEIVSMVVFIFDFCMF